MAQCTEKYIESLYYHRMYNSPACWRGDPRIVDRELKKLKFKFDKYEAIKENIRIQWIGFGWEWCATSLSENRRLNKGHEL